MLLSISLLYIALGSSLGSLPTHKGLGKQYAGGRKESEIILAHISEDDTLVATRSSFICNRLALEARLSYRPALQVHQDKAQKDTSCCLFQGP